MGWWRGAVARSVVGVACLATLGAGVTVAVTDVARDADDRPPATTASATPTTPNPSASTSATGPRVAPLNRVVAPDLLVVSKRAVSATDAARIEKAKGVNEAVRVAAGTVRVGSRRATLLGVDPSTFRAWTPLASAKSDALWRALAYEQLVLTFDAAKKGELDLGDTYAVTGERALPLRLGGIAELQLPKVDGLVTAATARGIGLPEDAGMLVNAPGVDLAKFEKQVRSIVGRDATIVPMRAAPGPTEGGGGGGGNSRAGSYLELYQLSAKRCPGLSWTVLAAIGQVESGHGQNMGPSTAGALGPMQFLPGTWRSYGVDGNRDGKRDIWDPYDAVPAAADYLCASGAGKGGESLYQAIFAYNHSDAYVRKVLATAAGYARR